MGGLIGLLDDIAALAKLTAALLDDVSAADVTSRSRYRGTWMSTWDKRYTERIKRMLTVVALV